MMMANKILTPFLDDYDVLVYKGDCIEVMRDLPEASVDAIVTDPPYGLEFMGREWDGFGTPLGFQTWSESWAREALRVLKPGGHLLAFAGTRTYHRMASGVEDAGFEVRDCIAWMYGSGFPKSLDVSKALDKAAGADRERVVEYAGSSGSLSGPRINVLDGGQPVTADAREWNGWGTALKPAFEPVVVARKPLMGTVARNVLEHGTGALNIDGCRIAATDSFGGGAKATSGFVNGYASGDGWQASSESGRWPANVALDDTAAAMLDQQTPVTQSSTKPTKRPARRQQSGWDRPCNQTHTADMQAYGDSGGASRFFYTAKASRQDRNAGGLADNTHPTVKPTELMRWLVRLVTPPSGIVLDPFGGSGSTGLACRAENTRCILIEREDEYLAIIRDRLAQLSLFSEEARLDDGAE